MTNIVHLPDPAQPAPEMGNSRIWDSAPVVPFGQEIDIIDPTRRPGDWQRAGEVARRVIDRLVAARFTVIDSIKNGRCAP